jgi:Tetratricopeptide repeat
MPLRVRFTPLAVALVPAAAFLLLAAAPPQTVTPEELVRRANDALRAGDSEAAEKLYAAAEERTADPGRVAFNRGVLLFERGDYRAAELQYDRVLADAACPPERVAKAWFNRGTCLLHRGGSVSVYRSAIACFENAIDTTAADEPLKADARHNLELAKLLWLEEAKKEQKSDPPSPNSDIPPEESRQPQQEPERRPGESDGQPGHEAPGGTPKVGPQPVPEKKDGSPAGKSDQTQAGNNANLPVLDNASEVQNLSPEDARKYLKAISERRKRELRAMLETLYGPERVDVRDW